MNLSRANISWLRISLAGLLVFIGLYLSTFYSYLLFHSLAEFFSIAVACGIFIVAWNTRRIEDNPYLLFLGIAYLFVAGVDMVHTLAYKGMGVFTSSGGNLSTQLWIAGRYTQALSLLIAPALVSRRFNPWLVMAAYAAAVGLLLGSIFYWQVFPVTFVEGTGLTPFKKISEYLISLILLAAIAFTVKKRHAFNPKVLHLVIASIITTIGAELAFTFYVSVYGLSNTVGHFLKIISFFLIYKAIVETGLREPYQLLFRNLKQNEQALQEARDQLEDKVAQRTAQLSQSNENLRQEIAERLRAEEAQSLLTHDLGERVKELGLLYHISGLMEKPGITLAEVVQKVIENIPPAWQYPEITCARIILNGQEFKTKNFAKTPWKQEAVVHAEGVAVGIVEVCYLEARKEMAEGPFLQEERNLIKLIAEQMGRLVERLRAEEEIKESEEKYRLLVENANDAIFVVQDGILKFPNPKTEEITGYSKEELASTPLASLIHPDDRRLVIARHEARLAGGAPPSAYTFRTANKNGENIWVQLNAAPIVWEGRPATLNFLRDISELKQMERQVQLSQKMQAIGTLAGGIAHDFNNILGVIFGYAELVQGDLAAGEDPKEHLGQILKAGDRAKKLVRQILSFSRQSDQEQQPFEVRPVVKETLELMRASLPANIEINQDLVVASGSVMGDPTQMHQVLMNLCTNAAQAMGQQDGVLEVSLERVVLDDIFISLHVELEPGPHLRLSVSDTGQGMDKITRDRIFEPFFTTKKKGDGTGLGLAVVHGIIRSHGGAITVYSELGQGTTFRVYLPLLLDDHQPRPPAEVMVPEAQGEEHVLLVDDEEALLDIGSNILEGLGYQVTSRASSLEALELFRADPSKFDLVVTDQSMPQMSGSELSREILAVRPDLPIIICTGYSENLSAESAQERGIRRIVTKPVVAQQLATAVREVLDQKR
jgi:PAS domain S-box-containing protein